MRHLFGWVGLGLVLALCSCSGDSEQAVPANQDQLGVKVMNPPKTDPSATPTPQAAESREDVIFLEPDITAKSQELVDEFVASTPKEMNAKYAGKVIEVQGTICFVDQVTFENGIDHGAIYVNLCPTEVYQPKTVRCEFVMDTMYTYTGPKDRLLIIGGDDTLSRGEEVVIRGYYKMIGPRDFRLDDCQLMRH